MKITSNPKVSAFDNGSGLQLLAQYSIIPPSYASMPVVKSVGATHGHWEEVLCLLVALVPQPGAR